MLNKLKPDANQHPNQVRFAMLLGIVSITKTTTIDVKEQPHNDKKNALIAPVV